MVNKNIVTRSISVAVLALTFSFDVFSNYERQVDGFYKGSLIFLT